MYRNPYQQLQPHFAPCYPCGVYGYFSKNCPQWALTQQNVPGYLRSTPPYVNRLNTPQPLFPQGFLPNSSPRLTQQHTTGYALSAHVWNEITDKMNEIAEENRLIKHAVLGTYERMKGNYSRLRDKISSNQNKAKDDNSKQLSQSGRKSIQFQSKANTGTIHSPNTVTHSGNAMDSISKLSPNLATSTNSVSTIEEETKSQLDAKSELDWTHEFSLDCEAIVDILHPDIDYGSDSDSDELTYVDEWLKDLNAMEHIVSTVQPSSGRVATFNVKVFSTEPVITWFDTEASCSCTSFSLYNQISNKTHVVEMQLQVGQVDSTSLCPKGVV